MGVEIGDNVVGFESESARARKEELEKAHRRCSFTCLLDSVLFTVRNHNDDSDAISAQAFGLIVVLVGYLQQLSLVVLDDLEYGLWGDIFGNINILSLNVNINFGEIQGDIAYLVGVYLLPVAFMLWYIKIDKDQSETEEKLNWIWPVGWMLNAAFVIACIAVTVIVGFGTGFIFLIPVGYILALQLGYVMRGRYLKGKFKETSEEDQDKKSRFFDREAFWNDFAMSFTLPILASVWINVGVLNGDKDIALVGGIIGGILLFWLVMRLYLRIAGMTGNDWGVVHDFLKRIFIGLFILKDPYNVGSTIDLKDSFYFFPVVVYLEKIALAAIPNLASSDLFEVEDPDKATEIGEYIVLAIIFTTFAATAIFKPLESKLSQRAESFSRLSNLLLFTFALMNTKYREADDTLDEDEPSEQEFYFNIVMVFISAYMLCFWLRLLDIKEFVKWIYRANTATLYGFWAQHKWKRVRNAEDAAKIILPRKKQQMTENELRVLPYFKKFCGFCVQRTRTLTEEEKELVQVKDGRLALTYHSATGVNMDTLRMFGLTKLEGLETLNLGDFESSLIDFDVLVESGVLETLVNKGMRGFEIDYRFITGEEVTSLINHLSKHPLENFTVLYCTDVDKNDVKEFVGALIENLPKLRGLKSFKIEGNKFDADDNPRLIECLFSLQDLTKVTIADCGLNDRVLEYLATALNEREHCWEELKLFDNEDVSKIATLDKVAEAAMQTKTLRTLDVSGSALLTNKMFRLQEDYPDMMMTTEYTGYIEFREDRGDKCNVCLKQDGKEIELLKRTGFTKELADELEGYTCCILSTLLFFLNDEWREVAREHINQGLEVEDYDDENDEELVLEKTVAELVIEHGSGASLVVHTLRRLKNFGADFNLRNGADEKTLREMALEHKDKAVQRWAKRLKPGATEKKQKPQGDNVETEEKDEEVWELDFGDDKEDPLLKAIEDWSD